MSTEVRIPQIGFNAQEATLNEWLVQDGSLVTAGEPLYIIEIDKAVQEIEAPTSGRLKIHVPLVGEAYPVGTLIAEIL